MKFITIFIIISISIYINVSGQDPEILDSLFNSLKTAKHDTIRVNTYVSLCGQYKRSNPDTARYYGNLGLKLAIKENYKKGLSSCYGNIGVTYSIQGNYDIAINYFLKSLKICEETGDKKGASSCDANIGTVYYNRGDYPKAIIYYQKSLKIKEAIGDKKGASTCYNNIGLVYYNQGSYNKAIEYYQLTLKIYEELLDETGTALCYNNIGMVYDDLGNYSTAIKYFQLSLKIYEQLGDKNGISGCYNNLGIAYDYMNNDTKAIEYYQKSLILFKELNAQEEISTVMGNISSVYIRLKNYPSAIEYAENGLKIALEIGSLDDQRIAYDHLYLAYKGMGKFKNALDNFELSKQINDSIFNAEKHSQLANIEAVYQNEKKQKEIELLNKDKKLQASENKKQRIIILSFLVGFFIILIFSVVISRLFLQKKKANKLLAKQNVEINQQKEEISTQRDEIEAQRDLVTDQKNRIEKIYKEVTDSINYAKRIQEAVLPISDSARSVLGEHFVLFKPKDIVSGDFYWTTKRNDLLFVAVADCTGHGVPGAFMSLLGISFLTEIVSKQEITQAGFVLNILRDEIINALQQRASNNFKEISTYDLSTVKDGMDIAFICINTETMMLHFAGANNPVYIVRNKKLVELKGDKMPIAIHVQMDSFNSHEYQIKKGDNIYLMSDGFEDQFGGAKNKKFMVKQLKELFLSISDKTMEEQKEILDKTLENWRGENEQIDDVTILGFRI